MKKSLKIRCVGEWSWLINGKSLKVGMTYGSNGNPNTYQYHLEDAANISGIANFGFIQEFNFHSEWDAQKAGIAKYKELFK